MGLWLDFEKTCLKTTGRMVKKEFETTMFRIS